MSWTRIDNVIFKLDNILYAYSTNVDETQHDVYVVFENGKSAILLYEKEKEAEDFMKELLKKLNEVTSGS